jgi:hypothetical protein
MHANKKTENTQNTAFNGHILAIEINDFLPSGHNSTKSRSRVIPNILHLLDHIDKYRAEGNFYITPEIMQDFPEVVSLVFSRGHEIGLCCDYRTFRCPGDTAAHRDKLEEITGKKTMGLMLKYGSKAGNAILKSLAGKGFSYFLTDFKLTSQGVVKWPVEIKFDESAAIYAFPPSLYEFFGMDINFGHPGKIRLYPYWFLRKCLRQFTYNEIPAVVNFPLWEFDPHLPRQLLPPLQSLRSYGNLSLAEFKLTRLLLEFDFIGIPRMLDSQHPGDSRQLH